MIRALERRGDGEGDVVWREPVGMVSRPIAGGGGVQRPRVHRSGVVAAWDGRLDEREALAEALGMPRAPADDDLAVVLEAYVRWGERAWERLLGDWALSLWDPRCDRLYLVRDPFGARPLYVHAQRQWVGWASCLGALRAAGVDDTIDEDWLVGYLGGTPDPARTPFSRVEMVPPGHALCFHRGRRSSRRFWHPEQLAPLPAMDDREFEERFASAFSRAVARRIPARGRVGVEMSGGLDSSSIACLAAHHFGADAADRLRMVSIVYRDCPMAHEGRYMAAVERYLGIETHRVWQEDEPALVGMDQPTYEVPTAFDCIARRERAITRYLRAEGATTLMRGVGGDQLLCSEVEPALPLADLAAEGRWRALPRALRSAVRRGATPYLSLAVEVVRWVVEPLGPGQSIVWGQGAGPAWLAPRVSDRATRQRDRRAAAWLRERPRLPSERMRRLELHHAIEALVHGHDRGPVPLEVTHPFLDRSLVELCLALPFDQLVRGDQSRSILRRGLRGRVPDAVLDRRSKATMQDALVQALRREMPRIRPILGDLRVAERGLVRRAPFVDALQRARYQGTRELTALLRVLALEWWLRARESGPRPAAVSAIG